jgi:hypothetical protein
MAVQKRGFGAPSASVERYEQDCKHGCRADERAAARRTTTSTNAFITRSPIHWSRRASTLRSSILQQSQAGICSRASLMMLMRHRR